MSNNKRVGKKYVPRSVITNPLTLLQPASKTTRDAISMRLHTALQVMEGGSKPSRAEWQDLADTVNIVRTAVVLGNLNDAEFGADVNCADDAMRAAASRCSNNGSLRLSGPGITSMRRLLEAHDALTEGVTAIELERIVKRTALDIERYAASNPEGVIQL